MREGINITLGGRAFHIAPTTIDQLCKLEEVMIHAGTMKRVEFSSAVVKLALAWDNPTVDIGALAVTPVELDDAAMAIAEHTGFYTPPAEVPADG